MSFIPEDPEGKEQFDEIVRHFRESTLEKMVGSKATLMISPSPGAFDVEFAMQIGACILLDKPLVILVPPGREVPPKLKAIADKIVEADFDTTEGAARVKAALDELLG